VHSQQIVRRFDGGGGGCVFSGLDVSTPPERRAQAHCAVS
jgi:hypothetical protein